MKYNKFSKNSTWSCIQGLKSKIQKRRDDPRQIIILDKALKNFSITEPRYASTKAEGGYSAIYHNKIPMDIKYVDYDRNVKHVGGAEVLNVKLFSYGNKTNASKIKLEIGSQYDPFLNMLFECDIDKYGYLKQQQGIHANFQQFPTLLIKCFNKVQQQCCCRTQVNIKGKITLNLLIASDGKGKFVINQSSEYKNIEVMSLDLSPENQQNIQQKVGHRYDQLRRKVQQTEQRLAKIQQIIKQKNPTLLTQIFKTTKAQGQGNNKLNISGV